MTEALSNHPLWGDVRSHHFYPCCFFCCCTSTSTVGSHHFYSCCTSTRTAQTVVGTNNKQDQNLFSSAVGFQNKCCRSVVLNIELLWFQVCDTKNHIVSSAHQHQDIRSTIRFYCSVLSACTVLWLQEVLQSSPSDFVLGGVLVTTEEYWHQRKSIDTNQRKDRTGNGSQWVLSRSGQSNSKNWYNSVRYQMMIMWCCKGQSTVL